MDSRFSATLHTPVRRVLALLLLVGTLAAAQNVNEPSFNIRTMTDDEVRSYVETALRLGLPQERLDNLNLLAINRGRIVVPLLTGRLDRTTSADSATFVHTAADILAYSGSEIGLDALAALCQRDSTKFGYFIGRLLDYSAEHRNPYALAYHALDLRQDMVTERVAAWVEGNAERGNGYERWAQALRERSSSPNAMGTVSADPLVSRMPGAVAGRLQQALAAAETRSKLPPADK